MLSEKTIEIDGATYTVKEQPMRVLLPIFEGDAKRRTTEMMKVSVYDDKSVPLGDGVLDFGFRDFNRLQSLVIEVYGLDEKPEDAPGEA